MTNPFQKASRTQLKARVALEGPTGSGKTWTGLEWATVLANGGTVAVVDTERGSASLYSDKFDFDVVAFEPPYDPSRLVELLKVAEGQGYAVVMIDSLSHFWEGEGGTLDMVDAAAAKSRSGNKFSEGWKVATPALRHLVDTMLGLDAHLVVTMRSKMEYVLEENDRGQKVPRKVGMAPVMRAGVEYEFTMVGDLDLDHKLLISKSRCDVLADVVVQPNRAGEAAQTFADWLGQGEPMPDRADVDALKERLNALSGDARKSFRDKFGHPDHLTAKKMTEAKKMVTRLEKDDSPPDGDGGGKGSGPDGPGVVAAGNGREPGGADDVEGAVVAPDEASSVPAEPLAKVNPEAYQRRKARAHALGSELGLGHDALHDMLGCSFTVATAEQITTLIVDLESRQERAA